MNGIHELQMVATDETNRARSKVQLCIMEVAGRLFGVDVHDVREINREFVFTPILHAPEEIKGYVNIRGQTFLILDLRLLLGFPESVSGLANRVVIFNPSTGPNFGVLVDKVGDIIDVPRAQIEERSSNHVAANVSGDHWHNLIRGECKLEDGLVVILNAGEFLSNIHVESSQVRK